MLRENLREKSSQPASWLIVGLGNPGVKYAHTRHNMGADTVHELARRWGTSLKVGRHRAAVGERRHNDQLIVLAVPTTYMNLSGEAVAPLVRRYRITDLSRLVVVHDELDLPPGVVKLKVGGGLAGNNGLASIKQHLHTADFARIRVGIGKPPTAAAGAGHVLRRPAGAEREWLHGAVNSAADAVDSVLELGYARAMNLVNTVPKAERGEGE